MIIYNTNQGGIHKMGRDLVLKKIKSSAVRLLVVGVIMGVLLALFSFVLFVGEATELAIVMAVLAVLLFLVTIIGVHKNLNPMKAHCLKRNPKLLEQADELFSHIIYQDKFIIYSERIIANAKDITQMAAFEDIVNVCESSTSYNAVSTQHELVLVLPTYQIKINVYAKKRETIDDLKYGIMQRCPKLQTGYTQFGDKVE